MTDSTDYSFVVGRPEAPIAEPCRHAESCQYAALNAWAIRDYSDRKRLAELEHEHTRLRIAQHKLARLRATLAHFKAELRDDQRSFYKKADLLYRLLKLGL